MPRTPTRLDGWESATRRVLPGPGAFLVFGELRLFEAVWQVLSRRYDIRDGEAGIGYARGRLPVDLVPVDPLVTWDALSAFAWVRMVVLLASAYRVPWSVWMVDEPERDAVAIRSRLSL